MIKVCPTVHSALAFEPYGSVSDQALYSALLGQARINCSLDCLYSYSKVARAGEFTSLFLQDQACGTRYPVTEANPKLVQSLVLALEVPSETEIRCWWKEAG